MTLTSDLVASDNTVSLYARFSPRLRAMVVDAIILVTMFYVGALAMHAITDSDGASGTPHGFMA